MMSRSRFGLVTGVLLASLVGCPGGPVDGPGTGSEPTAAPSAEPDEDGLDPTVLGVTAWDAPPSVQPVQAGELATWEASGEGLSILAAGPVGEELDALQVAVVFDRAMVPLTDLDTMLESSPVTCDPPLPGQARWAGTTTAVINPTDGVRLPFATEWTCTVAAGTQAVDGSALAADLSWSFATRRPAVRRVHPRNDFAQWKPEDPMLLVFNQPIDVGAVREQLSLTTADGTSLTYELTRASEDLLGQMGLPEAGPRAVQLRAPLEPATRYRLALAAGVAGVEGPLRSEQPWESHFSTYPAFAVQEHSPLNEPEPYTSLRLVFTTDVDLDAVAEHLTIEPPPPAPLPSDYGWSSRYFNAGLRLEPRTTYQVQLDGALADVHGQTLGEDLGWSFTTGDFPPRLDMAMGLQVYAANGGTQLPYTHLNVDEVTVHSASVDPERLLHMMSEDHDLQGHIDELLRNAPAQTARYEGGEANSWQQGFSDMEPLLSEGRGLVAVRMSSPQVTRWDYRSRTEVPAEFRALYQVTDLGTSLKVGPDGVEVWVTRLSDGSPVHDATVEIWLGSTRVERGYSDENGLFRGEDLLPPGWNAWDRETRVWALIREGEDIALSSHRFNDGIGPWNFDVSSRSPNPEPQVAALGFADRGIYRLGDEAHARVMFRRTTAEGLELPGPARVRWTFDGPEVGRIAEGEGELDAWGGFDVDVTLPAEGDLGQYNLTVTAETDDWERSAWVGLPARAYRAPTFRVDVASPRDEVVAGHTLSAGLDARYLFGAPMAEAELRWGVWRQRAWFAPDGWDRWSFGPAFEWWSWDPAQDGSQVVESGNGSTDEDGAYTIETDLSEFAEDRPFRYQLEGTVTDVDRQQVAGRTSVLVHPAAVYLGLRSTSQLPSAGSSAGVELAVVDLAGEQVAGKAIEVAVVRRTWDRVREKGMDGRWRWINQPVDEPLTSETLHSTREALAWSFTPEQPGYHLLTATTADDSGRAVRSELGIYVVGEGAVSWALSDDQRLTLVPDQRTYAPGDTARILVQSPRAGMQALVTVEREGVLRREVLTLDSQAATIEVPIGEEHRPNVFVSVLAVEGAAPQDSPEKGRAQLYMGLIELAVEHESNRLAVALEPSAEVYRPRDQVEVDIAVTRQDGSAVPGAHVVLYAVDHAVLSLTGYRTPDPHERFYAERPLSVLTADSRTALMDRASYLTKGADAGGGGGQDEESGMRNRFQTTVAWITDLETDANGRVQADFELPDNLTTFRLMAVVDEGAAAFGAGEREIRVSRPLIARPALPRFLRVDDLTLAGMVVHNNSEEDRTVQVHAEATGVTLQDGDQTIEVPAGGAVEVPFRVLAEGPGEAVFRFEVRSGEDSDIVEHRIPVQELIQLEHVATAGSTDERMAEQLAMPEGIDPEHGGLSIDLASTALVGAGSGMDYLWSYPHGCLEQVTSRALVALLAREIREPAGVERSDEELAALVERGLEQLADYRHGTGGLTYWPGSWRPSIVGTAYAVSFLGRARRAGYTIDRELLGDAAEYLREVLNGEHLPRGWGEELSLSVRSLVAEALAEAGQGDAGHNSRLFTERAQLSLYGQASLLRAITLTTGADRRTAELAQGLQTRLYIEQTSAVVRDYDTGRWAALWGSDDLATAATLEALLSEDPDHVLAPKLALGLVKARSQGRWHNTRATAAVLSALTRYHQRFEAGGEGVAAIVQLGEEDLFQGVLPVPASASLVRDWTGVQHLLGDSGAGELGFRAQGGRLYYEARLAYSPEELPARDEGFTLVRSLELLEGDTQGALEAGDLVQVRLRVVTPVNRHHVALIDPLPAGLEAVDLGLATSSQMPGDDEPASDYDQGFEEAVYDGPWSSWVWNHSEQRDDEVRLYADYMPAGVHTWRYLARATSPGDYQQPAATVEEMYEPEHFGRSESGRLVIGRSAAVAAAE